MDLSRRGMFTGSEEIIQDGSELGSDTEALLS
jgi:hypothetical protein